MVVSLAVWRDTKLIHVLGRYVIYLLPRISVGGAEKYLTTPYWLCSSTHLYPYKEGRDDLSPADIDGNGLIVQMRFKDSNGAFVKSARDLRIMGRRPIDDGGDGESYTVLTEGPIRNYDEVSP